MTTQIIQSLSRSHALVRPYFSISVTYDAVIGEIIELKCDDRQPAWALQLLPQWSVVKTSLSKNVLSDALRTCFILSKRQRALNFMTNRVRGLFTGNYISVDANNGDIGA
jgi:hypothetical protein